MSDQSASELPTGIERYPLAALNALAGILNVFWPAATATAPSNTVVSPAAPAWFTTAYKDLRESIERWPLWFRLGYQEVRRRYRRTMIGPFWATLSLGIFVGAMGLVWSNLWHQNTRDYLPFISSGMVVWTMVSTTILVGCGVFVSASNVLTQMRMPYMVLVFAMVWRNLILFAHNLIVFLFAAIYGNVHITASTLLFFPGLVVYTLNAFWISLLVGILCTRFRDVQQIVTSVMQVAMFVTPIFWSPEQLGNRAPYVLNLNFIYHLLSILRSPLMGQAPTLWSWVYTIGVGIIGSVLALYAFGRSRKFLPYWL
jgi:lipopolysaccharide transport system permease protein